MLSFLAAVSAPLRIRSQNESPGTSWVIIAIVIRGVSTVPPPPPSPDPAGLPPVDEHDTTPNARTPAPASAASRLNVLDFSLLARALITASPFRRDPASA